MVKPSCTGGKTWDSSTCSCACPNGQIECGGKCMVKPNCSLAAGNQWNSSTCSCTCLSTHEDVNGSCKLKCPAGQVRNSSGNCGCRSGEELWRGTCKSRCTNGTVRNDQTGNCDCPSGYSWQAGHCSPVPLLNGGSGSNYPDCNDVGGGCTGLNNRFDRPSGELNQSQSNIDFL